MSDPSEDVMDVLTGLEPGDDIHITTVREGEELEMDAHVTDGYHKPAEHTPWGWIDGELVVKMDLANDVVDRLDLATHSADIYADETKPGECDRVSFAAWDPEVEDGQAMKDEWTDLGDITEVEVE